MASSQHHTNNHNSTNHGRQTPQRPDTVTIWWTAARPHTLTASVCPCLVSFAANYRYRDDNNNLQAIILVWTVFCITVQLGTNLHNDYSDFIRGADDVKTRIGQTRATAAGWVTPYETCVAATSCLWITFMCGIYLIHLTKQWSNGFLWFLIMSSIVNAFAYTGGPYPFGYIGLPNCSIAYSGLGDVFVFLYFGLVATYMIPYLLYCQTHRVPEDWIPQCIYGIQIGLLAMNILVVNNLRDRHTDVLANKRTTSVRFGRMFSLLQYWTCMTMTYVLVTINCMIQYQRQSSIVVSSLVPFGSLPMALQEMRAVVGTQGSELNRHVAGAAKVQTLFCILLSIGLFLSNDAH